MIINKQTIEPGENKLIRMAVGRLPSNTRIDMYCHVYRSKKEGPTVLLMGGVHGDELNGIEIVRRVITDKVADDLQCGSVIAIPVLNIYGFNNFSRDVPDGKDVNRSFPGSSTGSLASRVARFFTKNIMPLIDFGMDFHTGGNFNYNFPQIRYTAGSEESRQLADAFAAPFTIATKMIPKSLRKVCMDNGKPVIVYEGGENLRLNGFCVSKGLAGIRRVLAAHEMLSEAPPAENSIFVDTRRWMRAKKPGLFRWRKRSGQKVSKGEPLGVICDPYGQEEISLLASKDGWIIGHNNTPVVGQGDPLFHIAS